MTRKVKIRFVVAAIVLGLIAWGFWPGANRGEVRIIYVGLAPGDSHRTSFIVTNSSKRTLEHWVGWREQKNGVWQEPDTWIPALGKTLAGQSAQRFELASFYLDRWKPVVRYNDSDTTSLMGRTRVKLATVAFEHNWDRICRWLYPSSRPEHVFGPEMLGNKPVEVAKP